MTSTRLFTHSASKPRDAPLKREQNSRQEPDNGLAKGVALDIPDTRRWLGEGMSEALG
jgi:hypothetical protein